MSDELDHLLEPNPEHEPLLRKCEKCGGFVWLKQDNGHYDECANCGNVIDPDVWS